MARLHTEQLPDMGDDAVQVRARRERLGVDAKELAESAGIHRNTLAAIEKGQSGHRLTLVKVLNALAELEKAAGIGAPPPERTSTEPHIVVVRLRNDEGEVVLEGPVGDLPALEASAARLLAGMRSSAPVSVPSPTVPQHGQAD